MRVLIADDDPVLTGVIRAGLRSKGWEVDVAADAMQAVMFASRHLPDAVVLDINMPGGTGFKALERLRASVKTAYIPILVVSGTQDPEVPRQAEALGAAGFLPKPVDVDRLYAELCRVLGVAPAG